MSSRWCRTTTSGRRCPAAPAPGRPGHEDYEYRRAGTGGLALAFDPNRGWWPARAGERRTARDFAGWVRDLLDEHYPDAAVERLVVDTLNTHHAGALYETFPADEARCLVPGAWRSVSDGITPPNRPVG